MPTVTKTIGASGDYATWAALIADAATAFSASDDAVIELIDAANYSEVFNLGSLRSAVAVSSIHLTSSGSGRHDGTPGSGAIIRPGGSGGDSTGVVIIPTAVDCRVSWLEITTSGTYNNLVFSLDDGSFSRTHEVDHCIVHDNGSPGSGNVAGVELNRAAEVRCHNNLVYNIRCAASGGAGVSGIQTAGGGTPVFKLVNNTVDDIINNGGSGVVDGIFWDSDTSSSLLRNNIVGSVNGTSSGFKECFHDQGSGTATHNASTDNSAFDSSTQFNIAVGNQFVDRANRDYRVQDTDADIWETGVTITGLSEVDTDLGGNTRSGTWSIGAFATTAAAVNGITLTSPVDKVVWQRTSGAANVTIAGDYTGTPTSIEYRWDGGSWQTLVASPSSGSFSEVVSLPEGQATLEVRFANDTGVADSVLASVGDLFWIAGQSNASGRLTSNQTYSHGSIVSYNLNSSNNWVNLADPMHGDQSPTEGSCWPLLATLIAANQSVPVAFLPTAEGGTSSDQWTPGSGAKYTSALVRVNGQTNGLAALLWDQGEADANSDPSTSQASYNAFLDALAADAQADTSLTFPTLVALTGTSNNSSPAGSSLDNVRAAQIEAWEDNADIFPGANSINRDSLHWESNGEGATQAALWWLAIEDALYGGSNGRGPRPSSITTDGSTCTIVFDRDLNTADTAYAAAAFAVDNDDGPSRTVSAATRTGARTVELTLSGSLDGTNPTLTFGSINTPGGVTVPRSVPISLPATINGVSSVSLPAEPIYAATVAESSGPYPKITLLQMSAIPG